MKCTGTLILITNTTLLPVADEGYRSLTREISQ